MITDALVVASAGAPFRFQRVDLDETLRPTECLIRIKATGVSISARGNITALAKRHHRLGVPLVLLLASFFTSLLGIPVHVKYFRYAKVEFRSATPI